jgi:hypothetical protein
MNNETVASATPDNEFAPQIMQVRVTNGNAFDINDRFDGVPYNFPKMTPVDIPVDAAHHIFGWFDGIDRDAMRLHCQRRFGWNTPERITDGSASLFFDQLHIAPIRFRLVQVAEDDPEPPVVQKDTQKKYTNKLMASADERAASGRN